MGNLDWILIFSQSWHGNNTGSLRLLVPQPSTRTQDLVPTCPGDYWVLTRAHFSSHFNGDSELLLSILLALKTKQGSHFKKTFDIVPPIVLLLLTNSPFERKICGISTTVCRIVGGVDISRSRQIEIWGVTASQFLESLWFMSVPLYPELTTLILLN